MIVYQYDRETNEYIGSLEAALDKKASQRLQKEVYLIPVYTTKIAPPEVQEGYVAVFTGTQWIIQEDHRGEVIYDMSSRESKECTEIGKIPVGYSTILPERLEDLKSQYIHKLKSNFMSYMQDTKLHISSVDLYFSYDSVERLKNEQNMGISISRDDNNKIYTLTNAEYDKIIKYLVIFGQYLYIQKWRVEKIILSCQSIDLLKTYQGDLEFNVSPKLIDNIAKMTQAKRKEYFDNLVNDLK